MWLAGIPVADKAVLQLAGSLREAELVDTAERLERAYDREARIVALDVPDREEILRVLEECPDELLELRATLLQERVWREAEGLKPARTGRSSMDGRFAYPGVRVWLVVDRDRAGLVRHLPRQGWGARALARSGTEPRLLLVVGAAEVADAQPIASRSRR